MSDDQPSLNALLRQDLFTFTHRAFLTVAPGVDFVPNWHLEAIAHELLRCYQSENQRLIITVPPRYLKSISVSVAFSAWLLGHDPTRRILCASYNSDLAIKHALDARAVMGSPWYQAVFPRTRLDSQKNTQTELMTTRRGTRLATSVGGTLTGRGGDVVIIDDAHKADEALSETKRDAVWEWYRSSLVSRLDSKQTGTIIVIQQRLHEEDLVGHLLEQGGWTHLNLPAIAEDDERIALGPDRWHARRIGEPLDAVREPLDVLESIKAQMGSHAFAAQYQQRPMPLGGGLLKLDWFGRYEKAPLIGDYTQVTQSWDTAFKGSEVNDPSVCLTFVEIENRYYLIDVYRKRLEYPDLKRAIERLAQGYRASRVLIEDAGSGMSLIQDLRRESPIAVIARQPENDKVIRAERASALIEAGRVLLPRDAPWLADFEHEVAVFPKGKHDDQVDALSQFINWRREHPENGGGPCAAFSSALYVNGSPMWLGVCDATDYDGQLT